MSIFDLIFLCSVLVSIVCWITTLAFFVRKRNDSARKTFRNWFFGMSAYFMISMVVSLAKPQKVYAVGETWCFDDWCITVDKVSRTEGTVENQYDIDITLSSRARGITQRAKGAWIYLIDEHGVRYTPLDDATAVPLDVQLKPGESVATKRVFKVPSYLHRLGLVTGHGGPYCNPMNFFIIGESGCLFQKPTMVRIE